MAVNESVVWAQSTLNFAEMVSAGQGLFIAPGDFLLALEDTVNIQGNNLNYLSTRCLWINTGEIVFNVSNDETLGHSKNYRIFNDKACKETVLV